MLALENERRGKAFCRNGYEVFASQIVFSFIFLEKNIKNKKKQNFFD